MDMNKDFDCKFVKYDQSERIKQSNQSSVSYAAGIVYN